MAKLTKTTAFKAHDARPETQMEKTTRIVMQMVDDEAEKRHLKNTRLRNARLEREANTPPAAPKAAPKAAGNARTSETAAKR